MAAPSRIGSALPASISPHSAATPGGAPASPSGTAAARTAPASPYLGTIELLTARDIPDALLARARHLHVGAYFMQKHLHPGAPALFRRARRLGLTTSLDCNFDPEEKWDSGIRRVLPHTDVFFPNEDEAARLTGCSSPPESARALAALCRVVVVKMGAQGAYVCSGEKEFHAAAVNTRVVDTTGAGDSFAAGFLREFIRGADLRACARGGARAAARCVTAIGGTTAFLSPRSAFLSPR